MPLPDPQILETIKGFLDPEEGRRLYTLALEASRRGPCLEVGSYCGKSTAYLGCACRDAGGNLYAVDHHRGSEEQQPGEEYFDPDLWDPKCGMIDTFPLFRRTLMGAGLEEVVVPVVSRSTVAARSWATPLSLVFIDGGHAFETVLSDYESWVVHLLPGGYLLFHDIFSDAAQGGRAPYDVYRLALDSGRFEEMPMTVTLGVLRRKSGESATYGFLK